MRSVNWGLDGSLDGVRPDDLRQEALSVVSTIADEGVLADLRKLASVIVACNLLLDKWPAEPEASA